MVPLARQQELHSALADGPIALPSTRRARKQTELYFQMLSATTSAKHLNAHQATVNFPDPQSSHESWLQDLPISMASSSSDGNGAGDGHVSPEDSIDFCPTGDDGVIDQVGAPGARGAGLNATWTEAAPRRTAVMPLPNARISA